MAYLMGIGMDPHTAYLTVESRVINEMYLVPYVKIIVAYSLLLLADIITMRKTKNAILSAAVKE